MKTAGLASTLLHQPRKFWLRKAIFQVHLWVGLAAALYLVLLSLSGSVLVFNEELVRWTLPAGLQRFQPGQVAAPEDVLRHVEERSPGAQITNLQFPTTVLPAFLLEGTDHRNVPARWIADPETGSVQTVPHTWIDWTHDLHYYLLLPKSWGMQANGVGAAALLLLTLSGIALWWPGAKLWTRSLQVNFKAGWRRINYDLHNAIGFWTLLIVFWWAFSGVYFGWYRQVSSVIAIFSPIQGMESPAPGHPAPDISGLAPSLRRTLLAAQSASSQGRLWSVSIPGRADADSYVLLDRGASGDFSHRDIVRVRADAKVLSVWHYGERHTLADWVLWSMHPLHFGTTWGLAFKIAWSTLGLCLAVLTVTGTLMYWNRFLRHRGKRLGRN